MELFDTLNAINMAFSTMPWPPGKARVPPPGATLEMFSKHTGKSRINFPPMLIWIGLGGAVGSILRYLVGGFVQRSAHAGFPAGTLAVNIIGGFLIGVFAQHYMNVQTHPTMRALLITGFCGGFTTFSAFSLETVGLLRGGEYGKTAAYVVLSVSVSILATISGMAAARAAA